MIAQTGALFEAREVRLAFFDKRLECLGRFGGPDPVAENDQFLGDPVSQILAPVPDQFLRQLHRLGRQGRKATG